MQMAFVLLAILVAPLPVMLAIAAKGLLSAREPAASSRAKGITGISKAARWATRPANTNTFS
jgi:hypothetical protein